MTGRFRQPCIIALLLACGCTVQDEYSWGPLVPTIVDPGVERDPDPDVTDAELDVLVAGNSAFAFDMYGRVCEGQGNVFFSPHSISVCMAMTYAGAEGETEAQMAETMRFDLGEDRIHPAFNRLDMILDGYNSKKVRVGIVNDMWGQTDYAFLDGYLQVLAINYGTSIRLLDFVNHPEEARQTINSWISHSTDERIEDLLPPGLITPDVRLVLTNAIFFKGKWRSAFDGDRTRDRSFSLIDGSSVTVPLMHVHDEFDITIGEGWSGIEIPYAGGDLAMLIIKPQLVRFHEVEASVDGAFIRAAVDGLHPREMDLHMPRFTLETEFSLGETLMDMGMSDAFDPGLADLSGMDGTRNLYIMHVVHKAFVAVDESGTEAAAATGVVEGVTSVPPSFTVDSPFIFMIRDVHTGAILFLGRVMDPTA